jgi:hypothetical protein
MQKHIIVLQQRSMQTCNSLQQKHKKYFNDNSVAEMELVLKKQDTRENLINLYRSEMDKIVKN